MYALEYETAGWIAIIMCIVAVIKILLGGFQIFISQIHIIASTALTLNMLPFLRFKARGQWGMGTWDRITCSNAYCPDNDAFLVSLPVSAEGSWVD